MASLFNLSVKAENQNTSDFINTIHDILVTYLSCEYKTASITPLFLLTGVAFSGYIPYYMDAVGVLQPIVTRSQERRICAELCMTGLGGSPCGDDCFDLTPQGLPLQSFNGTSTSKFGVATRYDACSVLCENGLGEPLCHCGDRAKEKLLITRKTDFVQVCGHFCVRYDYRIFGCQACPLYKNATGIAARMLAPHVSFSDGAPPDQQTGGDGGQDGNVPVVDWDLWCQSMCQEGNGGAACNCDLLPMSLKI
ncbi:hypothetical protein NQ315_009990 [Exocentrus adspersus]|uniref:WSC domain-containing protein n=1 Tax=Exocentrus adspersus TaxID=1586481 RepID=A0AAV8WIF2_9CUCU|nr:hypothetical protein NQ315_009990 [Exocentrus adspersus]